MATLSLYEIAESQLSETPIKDGQLICCLDTGRFYRDTISERIALDTDVIYVSSLPLAPITNRIYLLMPNSLYTYDGTGWIFLNNKSGVVITADTIYDFPSVGSEDCIYIDKSGNKTYRFDSENLKYYCIGSNYNEIEVINGSYIFE